ncbi:glycoside hydrolase [Polyplosphaeria fusca]|uniref:chitinase n=1 Tax=Polyplosphaeria fusca TaxID=682080 RepID=A0A9P4R9N7_9PLEO|nr:glycoside hydrolase [Polyplosphaeria fusca]
MRITFIPALLLAAFAVAADAVINSSALAIHYDDVPDISHAPPPPILDIGLNYILGQSLSGSFTVDSGGEGPVQCSKDKPCADGSCCNSDGKCGFQKAHCQPDPPTSCLSNCNATAMCGVDSEGGRKKCGLNLCCSYYGWCGTNSTHCGDKDENGFSTPCQKGFGGCEVVPPPKCPKEAGSASKGRKIGYYQGWNTRTRNCNRIFPEQIKSEGFTHLYWAFAAISPQTFHLVPSDPSDPDLYPRFTALKKPNLQTWIAVGGWDFSDPGTTHTTWSDMVSEDSSRAAFVKSAVALMEQYGFQGLDLDWEYPASPDRGGRDTDTENLTKLVKELREAFGTKYGLSSVLAPDYWYLRGMDPKAMEQYVDWFGFMAYDLHGFWDKYVETLGPRIRPQADLRDIEKDLLPLWFDKLDPKKINFGVAYYGRGYTVKEKSCMYFDCEFVGPSKKYGCTDFDGFMSNHEIQDLIKEKSLHPEIIRDAAMKQASFSNAVNIDLAIESWCANNE